jgi:hypothetical protein
MHYKKREKVQKLIGLGSLSSLAPEIDAPQGEGHSYENPVPGVTVAYYRDRGENFNQRQNISPENFFASDIEEYGYLYTLEGEWLVKAGYSSKKVEPQKLASILSGFETLV